MITLFNYSLTLEHTLLLTLCGILIGLAKTGLHGVGMLVVPLMALIFGAKASVGIVLGMLIIADLFAVTYYHRHANWKYLIKLFPSAGIGVILATVFGNLIDDALFAQIMALIIFLSLAIMIALERIDRSVIPDYLWFAILMGALGGFTTMVGNLAGPVMAVYLLSMRLPKNEYIGTAAWFFLIINVFKVPFHIFSWETISVNSILLNLSLLPVIAIGALIGIIVVKRIPETSYRWLVIVMTGLAASLMLV
uniref:sulfite exporter TauE/SafE family protein n=1 Tax=Ningiella ruwaisensis TaxID=2364274 RepID=UPI00109F296F|nr:sulfite exporter TauE/SafE family protein [Ningiella ruwaisensis]